MMQHSIRLYEKEHPLMLTTKIIKVVEQPIKITTDGKSNMLNALVVILQGTIFHPQGGGQPADKGTINGVPVLAVNLEKAQVDGNGLQPIYHFLDPHQVRNRRFAAGQQVEISVDASFRLQCQRSHTVGHLIADVLELNPQFNGYQAKAVRGHHFSGGEYVKVLINKIPDDLQNLILQINESLNESVSNDLPIAINYLLNNMRHIRIGNSERMCGGTHLKSTKAAEGCKVTKIKSSNAAESKVELTIFYQCS